MAKRKFDVQVTGEGHYGAAYDTFQRFSSYFYQIDFTRAANPKTVLEIGIGNGLVADYLKRAGYKVTTCDFDKRLKPDVVADIRDLNAIKRSSHDVVIACEILEHIPFDDVPQALAELARVAKKRVVISVPHSSFTFELIGAVSKTYGPGKTIRLPIRIPQFLAGDVHRRNPEHYWELGRRGYSVRKFKKLLRKHFKHVAKDFHPHLNPYHRLFILEV
ncbi:MAG: methyltransferase domain-containing protein [bacterium]|nr:methyltransferase domain-containing protein [bacterium]MDZ4247749.1 methyltransferase domain-containing protein [Patescibacteria group bacterium]